MKKTYGVSKRFSLESDHTYLRGDLLQPQRVGFVKALRGVIHVVLDALQETLVLLKLAIDFVRTCVLGSLLLQPVEARAIGETRLET